MAEKIIKVAFFKPKEPAWKMTKKDLVELNKKITQIYTELEIKPHFLCNCYWSNEEWMFFVVEEHKDIESVQKLEARITDELQWQRSFDSKLYLGTPTTVILGMDMSKALEELG